MHKYSRTLFQNEPKEYTRDENQEKKQQNEQKPAKDKNLEEITEQLKELTEQLNYKEMYEKGAVKLKINSGNNTSKMQTCLNDY